MRQRRPKGYNPSDGTVVVPGKIMEQPDVYPPVVADMTIGEANRAAPELGMLILRGINVSEMKELGISITGQNAVDVGRGVIMVAAASAHETIKLCAERLAAEVEPESFSKIAAVQGQHLGHLLSAGKVLASPDTRPAPSNPHAPSLPAYADSPVQLHLHASV